MIKIARFVCPFSHQPKTRCLIPGTQIIIEAFPTCVRFKDFKGKVLKEVSIDVEGPLKQFTVMQDLKRGCVTIFSEQYRFHILPSLEIVYTKSPHLPLLSIREQLCFGIHKKQEWEQIKKRGDLREIFPIWFRLGSLIKLPKREEPDRGMFSLLKKCREAIESHRPQIITPAFYKLFLAGFSDLFIPRLYDEEFQGILPSGLQDVKSSPLYLLKEGAELIRSLFLVSSGAEHAILPNLPPQFFAGRMLHLACPPFGELDLEWTKKTIRCIKFHAIQDGEIHMHFPPGLRRYRVRQTLGEKGHIYTCGEPLEIKSDCDYLLDQFQK